MLEYETYFGGAPDVDYTLVIPDELIFNPYTIVIQNLEKIKTLKDDIANLEKDESKSEELEAKKKELADEEAKFGIEKQEFKVDVKAKLINITSPAWSVTAPDPNYTLYYNMILYFANGGGACYIVSVGSYTDQFDAKNFTDGINALKNEQEPTMVVVPEAVNGLNSMWKTITEEALMHCGKFMKTGLRFWMFLMDINPKKIRMMERMLLPISVKMLDLNTLISQRLIIPGLILRS